MREINRLEDTGVATRPMMTAAERAKQFMPFAALRGYEEALRAKEKIVVDRKELSEERMSELDQIMQGLQVRNMVQVVYYSKDEYLMATGMVSKIDVDSRIIKIVSTKINFDDIYSISIVDS